MESIMTTKKYEFTGETKTLVSVTVVRRIRRLSDKYVGGWIEKEENLSHEGDCFVYDDARVHGRARVYGDARVHGSAVVSDEASVYDRASVFGRASVSDDASVYSSAVVSGAAVVSSTPTVIRRSDGYEFIYVPCADEKKRVIAGCRYLTMDEALEHWKTTRGGTPLGEETLKILDCLKKLDMINQLKE